MLLVSGVPKVRLYHVNRSILTPRTLALGVLNVVFTHKEETVRKYSWDFCQLYRQNRIFRKRSLVQFSHCHAAHNAVSGSDSTQTVGFFVFPARMNAPCKRWHG